jgi:carbamoyl-phosphate synthase large subunit
MITIMTTGVGAIIGYGILKSLRKSNRDIRLIGADIYPDAIGQAWADHFIVAPLTSSANYLDWLKRNIITHKVDLVIPGIEQDVYFFSKHRKIFDDLSVKVAINNKSLIELTHDKWLMHQKLLNIDSSARIDSYLDGDFDSLSSKLGLPFILKPRCSYASKGLVKVYNKNDFMLYADKLGDTLMAQPMIGTDDQEYTVAIFGDGAGHVCSTITLRRRLAIDGSTAKAWVDKHTILDQVVTQLCSHFKPIGPTNLQFRRCNDKWQLLEINPRISSTLSLRSAFGYNEAAMCVDFYLNNKKITQPIVKKGFAIRYIEDYIIYDRDNF